MKDENLSHQEKHHEHKGSIRESIVKISLATVLLLVAVFIEKHTTWTTWQLLLVYLIPYLIVGFETLHEAVENIAHRELFDENFLMSIATLGAFGISFFPNVEPQFTEAVFVMLFFQVGELFEHLAEHRSRRSIAQLMDIRPDTAHVEREGELLQVHPSDVQVGEVVVVKPGERVPMDGVVLEGSSSLDTRALTGESVPRGVTVGDDLISGCVNLSGLLRMRVARSFGESTASKVLELVENANENKSKSESFISRFAKIYTPIVVFSAIALAFIPPLFAAGTYLAALPQWLYRALTFLVVSCPCALVISVPLAFFGGIGGASRQGILVKGSNYLEALSKLGVVVFDKTGTLTHGVFEVSVVHPLEISEQELLHLAAHVERYSNHPIAISLRNAYPDEMDDCTVDQVEEIAGQGIQANVNGSKVCVGNEKLMRAIGVEYQQCDCQTRGTVIYVAIEGKYVGHILIADREKEDTVGALRLLKQLGVSKTVMLTGDHLAAAKHVAQHLGLDDYFAELLPAQKVEKVEKLLQEKLEGRTLAFIGDGINDAPVLARADVGIAMGGLGSDAAIEAADVVLMDDQLSKIALAVRIARKTLRIARENIVGSIAIKVMVLLLASVGVATLWMAVFADVGVTVLAVFNAMRALNVRNLKS